MPYTIFPTGTTIYDPEKAYNCHVHYEGRDGRSFLIDMNGNTVHTWNYTGFPSEMIDPAINNGRRGDIVCQKEPEIYANETLLVVDWDSNILWEWGEKAPGGKAMQNHDLARLANGNMLAVTFLKSEVPGVDGPVNDQAIYEINPQGEIVWRWISSEHIEALGFTGEKKELLFSKQGRPRSSIFVINDMQPLGPNKWYNKGDERFHPDNIMIDSREGCFIAIIDKKTGGIVFQIGPEHPGAYDHTLKSFSGKCPRPLDYLSGQHDAHMIPEDLPGAGNILVFDNQGPAGLPPTHLNMFPGSRVLEIDPLTEEILWQYDASSSKRPFWTFYSSFISSARRLPNGNTLICEGMHGRFFQVTPDKEIVWEYVNPYFGIWKDPNHESGTGLCNWAFRAQPIPYEWVPEGTPRSEEPVIPPDVSDFRVNDVSDR